MSMAYTAAAIAIIGMATTATTQYIQADNAADLADYNKKVADNAALDAAQRGAVEAADHRAKVRRLIATQNATFAGAGVDPTTGTADAVMTDTAGFGELDALRILNNAQNAAQGYRAQGQLEQWKGDAAFMGGMLGMAGSAMSSASSAYFGGKSAGLWGKGSGSGGSGGSGGSSGGGGQ